MLLFNNGQLNYGRITFSVPTLDAVCCWQFRHAQGKERATVTTSEKFDGYINWSLELALGK